MDNDMYANLFGQPVKVTNIQPEALSQDDLMDALRILQAHGNPDEMKTMSIAMERDSAGRFRYAGETDFHIVDDWAHKISKSSPDTAESTWPPEGCDWEGVPFPKDIYGPQGAKGVCAPVAEERQAGGWFFRFLVWYFGLSPIFSVPLALLVVAVILVILPVK